MRDTHARLAGEAGVLIPITTDAHSVGALDYAELGVAQARRAWLTKEQILNTRSWRDIAKLAEVSDFRDDGALALEWVASYLERVGELPVLSQVEPGAIRAALPPSPPDEPEPFSAVLRRPRRAFSCPG